MRFWGCAVAALAAGIAPVGALAQQGEPGTQAGPQPGPQDAAAPEAGDQDAEDAQEIVVNGVLPGAVGGDIPPEIQLSPADVRAYGVATIADLLTELAPQTGSGRGRSGGAPVVLLNGRRISSFAEIRDLPTEAILRVDILPEEVALKFGYRADQRVVNIVLRPRFRAFTTELEASGPTAGGYAEGEAKYDLVKITGDGRVNLDVQYEAQSGLLETERDLADARAQRTLVSPSKQLTVNGVVARNLSPKVGATVNARYDTTETRPLLGQIETELTIPADSPFAIGGQEQVIARTLDTLKPLSRTTRTTTAHGGFSLNGDGLPWGKEWRWSVTGNYDRTTTRQRTATGVDASPAQALLDAGDPAFDPFGPIDPATLIQLPSDTARSTSSVGSIDALFNGSLLSLPAGKASTSIRLTGRTSDFESRSWRAGIARAGDVARDSGSVQANLDLPIASRRMAVLDAIGDLSLNGNIEIEHLSDFGTLVTTGYGANWSPVKEVRLIASFTDEEGAPSASQLGDPTLSTPNVQVFDYVRGETATITAITGGNPLLRADSRHVMKLGVNVRPLSETDLSFSADYVTSTTRDQISSFPGATAAVEAAFPERFVRGADGRLVSIDNRPVNFARAEREQLRWGFNLSLPLTSAIEKQMAARRAEMQAARERGEEVPPPGGQARPANRPDGSAAAPGAPGAEPSRPSGGGLFGGGQARPGGGRGFGPGGGGRGFGPGGFGGRIQFSLYHTWFFKEQVLIREGLPILDLLDGAATGSSGGQPVHLIEANAGYSKDGLGVRLIGNWQSATDVDTGAGGSTERLSFGSVAKLNLRVFADMGQLLGMKPGNRWARGMRVTLGVNNLFDTRQRVTDESGAVPLNYQRDRIDATGRSVRISVRKLFF